MVLALATALALVACRQPMPAPPADSEIARVFRGTELWDAVDRDGRPHATMTPWTFADAQPGVVFRFRRTEGAIENETDFGCRLLPERLRREGFEVTSQPSCTTGFGFINVDPGGIVFSVVVKRAEGQFAVSQGFLIPQPWQWGSRVVGDGQRRSCSSNGADADGAAIGAMPRPTYFPSPEWCWKGVAVPSAWNAQTS